MHTKQRKSSRVLKTDPKPQIPKRSKIYGSRVDTLVFLSISVSLFLWITFCLIFISIGNNYDEMIKVVIFLIIIWIFYNLRLTVFLDYLELMRKHRIATLITLEISLFILVGLTRNILLEAPTIDDHHFSFWKNTVKSYDFVVITLLNLQ